MSYFEFAGMSTANIPGLLIERKNIYGLPERDVEKIHVPGRNGDVLVDYGSYKNVTVSYECAVTKYNALRDLGRLLTMGQQNTAGFTPWRGYQLLRDGWVDFERLAVCSSQISMEEVIANRLVRFKVTFDCKPQRYYNRVAVVQRSGAGSINIERPYGATAAAPRIEIVGSGTVTINLEGQIIVFTGLVMPPKLDGEYQWPSAVIDSEAMISCRYKSDGTREMIDIDQWPQFWQLLHTVSVTGSVTNIKIFPRWWSI